MARMGLWMVVGLLATQVAWGQTNNWQGPGGTVAPQQRVAAPQPLPPTTAAPQPQGAAPQAQPTPPPQAPFELTAAEEAELNRVLTYWQQASNAIKTFECDFVRRQYTGSQANAQALEQNGHLKYAAPDKGRIEIDVTGQRPEQWICDGKSVWEYNYLRKELVRHDLPPSLQGKAIVNGPLPFMFGAQAADLRARYWMRLAPNVPNKRPNTVYLQALPKFQQNAASFSQVDIMLEWNAKNQVLQPTAIQIWDPSGQNRTSYQFTNPSINAKDILNWLKGDPFKADAPDNTWRLVIDNQTENPPAAAGTPNSQAALPGNAR